ncbi:MAG: 3-oxoacyl-(acyl-carrier-protein) synthase 2 [Syntrophorhabdus sp. PtaB.Bin184]|nr:MAG: 3-oxoacyl-(acyl-carrier-protein) synthase 2 [Syntrophorhabdus sp. PtaB.Bin184]
MTRRVVATGIGVTTCLGAGRGSLVEAIAEARSGISDVTLFPTARYKAHIGGEIKHMPIQDGNRVKTFLSYVVNEALQDAGITGPLGDLELFVGTIHGSLDIWEEWYGSRGNAPCDVDAIPPWRLHEGLFDNVAERVHLHSVSSTCTSSSAAAALAVQSITAGRTGLAVVAGVEALTSFVYGGFNSLNALSPTACRPFDRGRDGLVLGEGAAALVLEDLEAARRRGADLYGELAGLAMTTDGKHLTAPDPAGTGLARCIGLALKNARVEPESVDYLNMHGVGTVPSDRMECVAVRRVFREAVSRIPMSSIKPMIGQTNGAGGAIDAAASLLCIKHGRIPATLHHLEPEPEFKGFDFVSREPRQKKMKTVVSINNAFCGGNTALVFRSV